MQLPYQLRLISGGEGGCFRLGRGSALPSKSSFPEMENRRQLLKDNVFSSVKAPQLNVCV